MKIQDEGTKSACHTDIDLSADSYDVAVKHPKTPDLEKSSPRTNRGRKQMG